MNTPHQPSRLVFILTFTLAIFLMAFLPAETTTPEESLLSKIGESIGYTVACFGLFYVVIWQKYPTRLLVIIFFCLLSVAFVAKNRDITSQISHSLSVDNTVTARKNNSMSSFKEAFTNENQHFYIAVL